MLTELIKERCAVDFGAVVDELKVQVLHFVSCLVIETFS